MANALLEGLVDPHKYVGGVPNNSSMSLYTQDATLYSTINLATWPRFTTGMVIQNVRRGYRNIYLLAPIDPSANFGHAGWPYKLVVPYGPCDLTAGPSFSFAPDLTKTMSMGRLASSILSSQSSTTSTTTAALSGTYAVAALADLRDVLFGTNPLSVTNMSQKAITNKDFAYAVNVGIGVRCNSGPDALDSVRPIVFDGNVVNSENSYISGTLAPNTYIQAQFGVLATPDTSLPGNVNFTKLENVLPDLGFKLRVVGSNAAAGYWNAICTITYIRVAPGAGNYAPRQVVFDIDYIVGGTGEDFAATVDIPAPREGEWISMFGVQTQSGEIKSYEVWQLGLYDERNYGGWRAIRWDNVGTDQTLEINSFAMIEGIATGDAATLVKAGTGRSMDAVSGATWDHVRSLYNDPTSTFFRVAAGYLPPTMIRQRDDSMTGESAGTMSVGRAGGFGDFFKALAPVAGLVDTVLGAGTMYGTSAGRHTSATAAAGGGRPSIF